MPTSHRRSYLEGGAAVSDEHRMDETTTCRQAEDHVILGKQQKMSGFDPLRAEDVHGPKWGSAVRPTEASIGQIRNPHGEPGVGSREQKGMITTCKNMDELPVDEELEAVVQQQASESVVAQVEGALAVHVAQGECYVMYMRCEKC
eukprot:gene19029-22749_t